MRLFSAIVTFLILSLVQTPIAQLLKVPFLFEHFSKHQQQNDFTLIEFIHNHYGSSHNDADKDEDEQLPFKKLDLFSSAQAIPAESIKTKVFELWILSINHIIHNYYILTKHSGNIFHPPRALGKELPKKKKITTKLN